MTDRVKPWVLMVSLLTNAALIGFLVAQFVRMGPPGFGGRPPHYRGVTDEAHTMLDRAFAAERPAIDKAMQAMDVEKRHVESLLRAETFDTAAFDAALAAMQAANATAFASLEKSLRTAAAMPREDRRALAEALSHLPPPGPPGPRGLGAEGRDGRPPA